MNAYQDLAGLGRHYLQADSYGAAAFCFYRALLEDRENGNAWNGLVLSLSLMRKEDDSQTVLARYALQTGVGFDRDMVTFVMMLWQQNPRALSGWLRGVLKMQGVSDQDQEVLSQMAGELETAYSELVDKYGEETLQEQGMFSLEQFAARRIELDWLMEESFDTILEQVKKWLEDPNMVLPAVRLLCMLPDVRSEKLLRRVSRNEQVDPKVRTHALLALRWLGVRGNAALNKFEESFIINLDNPEPELTVSVPAAYKPVLDRMKLWVAKQQGLVTPAQYEEIASTDEAELPEAINEKLNEADVPSILQEVAHMLIRAAYDQYYPLVPKISGTRQWAAALLMLMKDYAEGFQGSWPYGEPEQDETAILHRNWLLSASPDFYDLIEAARKRLTEAKP